jgi:hypothetical protein
MQKSDRRIKILEKDILGIRSNLKLLAANELSSKTSDVGGWAARSEWVRKAVVVEQGAMMVD